MFKHIIITRFNLSKRWSKDKNGKNVLDEEWLRKRYDLFEKFCFPSIESQSNQNFEWWVYFDVDLSESYKNRNEMLHRKFNNFIPKYELSYEDFEANLPKQIEEKLIQENKQWVVTTRIDNDDMFAMDTIEIMQKEINFSEKCVLEIPFGYTLELKAKSIFREVESYLNPFISLVEKRIENMPIETVYYKQHNQWKDLKTQKISESAQWIQVIHDSNVSNMPVGREVFFNKVNKRFVFIKKEIEFQGYFLFILRKFLRSLKRVLIGVKRVLKTKAYFKN
jgi:hypothetical protein